MFHQLFDLIGQYLAINLMGDLMDDELRIGNEKMVIKMISDQVPKFIGDQFDQPSYVHGKKGPKRSTLVELQKLTNNHRIN